jgi:pimeloyl-ACP methyl ester carboxylesterase
VLCAEDYPFYSAEEAERHNAGTYLGDQQTLALEQVCSVWPQAAVPGDIHQPLPSEVPVLLLSGEADPVTPPSNAELAARSLPNSLHVILPGRGHGVVHRGCVPDMAAEFVETGSVQGLDVDCAVESRPLPFFVNFAGPQP